MNEAQMLGITLPQRSGRRSSSERRSSSPASHRSSPATATTTAAATSTPYTVQTARERARRQRGSSTPSRLNRDPIDSRAAAAEATMRTNKFNIRNLLAKIAAGRVSPSTERRQQANDRTQLTRRCVSQPDQQRHSKRSLSASAPLRRARINDSTSSISGASTISQYYPSTVAAAQRRSPAAAAVSLRSSAGSVWTDSLLLPDSASTNSFGSVFSLKSSSTGASPALWTPLTPGSAHAGPPALLYTLSVLFT